MGRRGVLVLLARPGVQENTRLQKRVTKCMCTAAGQKPPSTFPCLRENVHLSRKGCHFAEQIHTSYDPEQAEGQSEYFENVPCF